MGQQSHQSDPRILNRRTLPKHHRCLVQLLRPGISVLDLGCGTGAISADIARAVGAAGRVVGMDRDDANLAIARQDHRDVRNLRFENGDILKFDFQNNSNDRFDIVTAARTLQWISESGRAIEQMKIAAKQNGRIVILDYNLQDTDWEPEPPADFQEFYQAFLTWRTANHWDNRMAEHLPGLLHAAGLIDVETFRCDEIIQREDADFFDAHASGIWLYVIQNLGPQLVHAGFLEESVRQRAEQEYADYVRSTLLRQTHSMLTVSGTVVV